MFSEKDIRGLHQYKYSGTDRSLLSTKVLNPYWWTNLVKIFPLWVAPNLITLIGLMFTVVCLGMQLSYAPDLGPVPAWYYYCYALGLFLYQSFDAIDGKQARRTGTSGPLGELFDHGCDALNTALLVILTAGAMGIGQSYLTLFSLIVSLSNFYMSTWEEYHTDTLFLGAISGPVEGIIMLCGMFIATGYFGGPHVWATPLGHVVPATLHRFVPPALAALPLRSILVVTGALTCIMSIYGSIANVYAACSTASSRPEAADADPYTRAKTTFSRALGRIYPFGMLVSGAVLWVAASPSLPTQRFVLLALILGFLFSLQVGRMIVSHVTHRPFPLWHGGVYPARLAAIVPRLPGFFGNMLTRWLQQSPRLFLDGLIMSVLLVVAGLFYARFARAVILDMCRIFDMNCLTIKYYGREKPKKTQ
ncbi:hypothetical protein CXG81DRAFT_14743 [Caulochytrium protostelioides]|uniref:Choline/ethanolaminephosphotransferase n=1 Tax=Caulochytrium protostelioides TaxID=1555241 RepID=A0A4P9X2C7_9FUNG|nr:hypothetical protein CXG81DRAFT_14743 [Caulochytrium protostelioides]|eukprot:RKO99268.1 hypothetical protein CXG81DRAFT_14743 [Caulochytrium protostelioides]